MALMMIGVFAVLVLMQYLVSQKRVVMSTTRLVVEYPLWRVTVPYRDITDVELCEEDIEGGSVPIVLVHRRDRAPLWLLGFGHGEFEVYSELHRRWSAAR